MQEEMGGAGWKPTDGQGSESERGLRPPRMVKSPVPEARAGSHLPGRATRFVSGLAPSSPSVLVGVRVRLPCSGALLYACCMFLLLAPLSSKSVASGRLPSGASVREPPCPGGLPGLFPIRAQGRAHGPTAPSSESLPPARASKRSRREDRGRARDAGRCPSCCPERRIRLL